MIKVKISSNFRPEKKYIIQVLLSDFLGLEYLIEDGDTKGYLLTLQNGNSLLIEDAFFNLFTESNGYLKRENIPDTASYIESDFSRENNLPIIFGNNVMEVTDKHIKCGIDICASSFFMLSRWEEHCINERDQYGNFPTKKSFLYRNNLTYRPIVNEYVEFLWNMLTYIGIQQKRKSRKYNVKITHDIDNFARFDSFWKYAKAVAGDIILRKNLLLPFQTTANYLKIKSGKQADPYTTFDFLMDASEEVGLKSHFYFIPGMIPETDVRYNINDKRLVNTIRNISQRGHEVGLHGTLTGFDNLDQFRNELKRLLEIYPDIKEGRQHYLRFLNPGTWQIWDDCKLKYDSTIGYEYDCGFRAGVCYEYPVFNILTRKKLNLIEQPLIFMESAMHNKFPDIETFMKNLKELVTTVKKYNGDFVFLWHNSNLNTYEWMELGSKYNKIIKSIV